ncbi:MAG: YgiQ family radical SAM protein [Planctomycetota bacterium]
MPNAADFLPMTPAEVSRRGWDGVDVVFVSGDAYVDHPSFAMAILGRALEAEGLRVAILSQPDWHSCEPWRQFGRPRLCFAVSAGNMDSMLNHYTASRKVRNDDAYSPGGQIGRRPDRATLAYCQRAREAFPGVPVIAGGVEASLRRIAHYDYWSDKVRRSILLDAKADILVYGMGEATLLEICRRLAAGQTVPDMRNLRGVAYRLGANEAAEWASGKHESSSDHRDANTRAAASATPDNCVRLPSYEEVSRDKHAFCEMTRLVHRELNPLSAGTLVQFHGREAVVVNPPAAPLTEAEMDRVYGLPFQRRPHPSYGRQRIPAFEVVKDSIQILRGCFGGCAFCSLGLHQGKIIQSRSRQSIVSEIRKVASQPGASGVISDLGGPSANMYQMQCGRDDSGAACRRTSCLHPNLCTHLKTDHGPLIALLKEARQQPGVRQVLVASGVRMDLAARSPEYVRELARHHTGGLLKVAPEHSDPAVLKQMHKPPIDTFEQFAAQFERASKQAGKEQHLVPYFMAGHPGSTLDSMIRLAQFLKRTGYRPDKVQDFIPLPMDLATCMYHTGLDPMTGKEVFVPRGERQRRMQRALLQFFKPENYADVRAALEEAGRTDLIGDRPECLIPAQPPRGAASDKPPGTRRHKQGPAGKRPPGPGGPEQGDDRPSGSTRGYRPHRASSRRGRRR